MKSISMFLFAMTFAGCGGVFQSGVTSKQSITVKDGVNPPQEVVSEQTTSGQGGVSVGLPIGTNIGVGGVGLGGNMMYGQGAFGFRGIQTQGCSVNPAMCPQIVTTPVYAGGGVVSTSTTTVASNGGSDPAIATRLDRIEQNQNNLRCAQIAQMPNSPKRDKALAECRNKKGAN